MAADLRLPVIDGHNDTLLNLHLPERGGGRSFFERSKNGHIDLPRAWEGGLRGGFFAMFPPPPPSEPDQDASIDPEALMQARMAPIEPAYARQVVVQLAARLFRLEAASEGRLRVVRTHRDLTACLEQDVMAAILHLEGAEAVEPDLDLLYVLHQAGLRSLGLVWSRPNAYGYGVPFTFPGTPDVGPGLTDAGKDLVRACNELGILIDVSHLNAAGFWDVAARSQAPLVATHSAVHALCPSPRNLTDRQLDAVRDTGGVVGVNFHVGFLRADGAIDPDTPLADLVHHVDYLVDRMGLDHVAFGSDFDGAVMPQALGDVAGLPRLLEALRAAGYDTPALARLTHQNWLRVLEATWLA